MGRRAPAGGARTVQVLVKFNPREAAVLDRGRGGASRQDYLRWLALREDQTTYGHENHSEI